MPNKSQTKMLTSDLLIIDLVVEAEKSEDIKSLVSEYEMKPGGKIVIDKAAMEKFSGALNGVEHTAFPGGSSFNISRTMSLLLGDKIETNFIGCLDSGITGSKIKASAEETNVNLVLQQGRDNIQPETAVSFVVKFADGSRSIATYPGNSRELITPESFEKNIVQDSNLILLQGSTRKKFTEDVMDNLLERRWDNGKKLVLALPTSAFQPDYFQWLTYSADVVLSNLDELCDVYEASDKDKALKQLRLEQGDSDKILTDRGRSRQVCLITDGTNQAYLVHDGDIKPIDTIKVDKVVNELGCGDASYAGFLAALEVGMKPEAAANFAMATGAANTQSNSAIMDNPLKLLEEISPRLTEQFIRARGSKLESLQRAG